ncbi:hypothetical protein DKE48_007585 [Acinetobacter nosocomialis]|nr:hypothetical protein DKE48_007585 [Acinetobacter nosocomialis]
MARPKASLLRPTATKGGRTSSTPKNYFFDVLDDGDLSKSTGNVGQQAKDNRRDFGCQCDIG